MADKFISLLEQAELDVKRADDLAAVDMLGALHEYNQNAAREAAMAADERLRAPMPKPIVDLNKIALTPGGTNIIAGPVESHQLREKAPDESEAEAKVIQGRMWLISFTDLFSLMLCFFLMLYSMKDPTAVKTPVLAGSHADNLHGGVGSGEAGSQKGENISRVGYGDGLNLSYLQGVLKAALVQVHLEKDVSIFAAKDHLVLHVDAEEIFNGNALNADGERVAKGLANRLSTLSNRITVVGVPSGSDAWATSVTQASAFSEMLHDAGYRKQFVVVGEGSGNNPGIEIRVDADDGNAR